jgi:excisionase family DNA binding protein
VSEERLVADFVTLEIAAAQLDVSENTVRQWIKKGLARASRRGGSYVLRRSEVERIRKTELRDKLNDSPAPGEFEADDSSRSDSRDFSEAAEGAVKPRVLPPRSREEENWPKLERRKRMGRRGADFSLESLHSEVRIAVEEALDCLDPRLLSWQSRLEELLTRQLNSVEETVQAAVVRSSKETQGAEPSALLLEKTQELEASLRASEEKSADLRWKLTHLEQSREELRKQLEKSHAENDQAFVERETAEKSLQHLRAELELLKSSSIDSSVQQDEVATQIAELQSKVEQSRQAYEQLQNSNDALERENLSLRAKIVDLEAEKNSWQRSRDEFEMTSLQQEARLLETTRLENELNRAEAAVKSAEAEKAEVAMKLAAETEAVAVQTALHKALQAKVAELEAQNQELSQEAKRFKEQVNGLQFKLQVQDPTHPGGSADDQRKLLGKLADMEAQMLEKDRIVNSGYSQLSEVRSKFEELQQAFYELQQRYDREKEDWSQIVAQQLRVATEQSQQRQTQQKPASAPAAQASWKGLFKPRGDF